MIIYIYIRTGFIRIDLVIFIIEKNFQDTYEWILNEKVKTMWQYYRLLNLVVK